jgi:hypothetical protein
MVKAHTREEKRKRHEHRRDGRRDGEGSLAEPRSTKAHGDLGYVGEVVRKTGYNMTEGGCVDHMLTSDVVPSFIETVRYSMKSDKDMGIPRSDMPKGREPLQSGPVFGDVRSMDHSGGNWASWPEGKGDRGRRPVKARKGEY